MHWTRPAVAATAVLHLGLASVLAAHPVWRSDPLGGGVHGASIALVLAAPGVIALLAVRNRWPLLLAAALASAGMALLPLSVHSFALAPLAATYAVLYHQGTAHGTRPRMVSLILIPFVIVAAFLAPSWTQTPLCYEQHRDGTITYSTPADPDLEGMTLPEDGAVERGCTSAAPTRSDTAIRIAGLVAPVAIALGFGRPRHRSDHPGPPASGP